MSCDFCRGCGAVLSAADELEDGLCGSALDTSNAASNCYDRFTRYAGRRGVEVRHRNANGLHVIAWQQGAQVLWDEWEAAGFPSARPPDFSNDRTAKELPF